MISNTTFSGIILFDLLFEGALLLETEREL